MASGQEIPLNKLEFSTNLFKVPQTLEEFKESSYEATQSKNKHHEHMLYMVKGSLEINRCMGQTSILLFGVSGAGKSSLVNNFFDAEICDISNKTSCTKRTVEKKAVSDNQDLKIKGLTMSLIDTPGMADPEGKRADARNFCNIQQFFKSHPSYVACEGKVYPNMILLVHKMDDKRVYGMDSELAKTIKALNELDVVDKKYPNVVMVFTHACKLREFEEPFVRFREIKESAEDLLSAYLKIKAPVLFVENCQKEDLNQIGDWFILPDGTKQLLNVYEAMQEILEQNGDKLASATISHFFKKQNELNANVGHSAKSEKAQRLSSEEKEWLKFFTKKKDATKVSDIENKFYNNFDKDLDMANGEILCHVLENSGIRCLSDLHKLDMKEIASKLFPLSLNSKKQSILQCLFGEKPLQLDSMVRLQTHCGKGYNIFKDIPIRSVYELETSMTYFTKYGLTVPNGLEINFRQEFRKVFEVFKTKEKYHRYCLKCLGLKDKINSDNIELVITNPGLNLIKSSEQLQRSILKQQVLFSARIDYHKANFTSEYIEDVRSLPMIFNDGSKKSFEDFFQKWGHYVVIQCYHGGEVEGTVTFNQNLNVSENFKTANLSWRGGNPNCYVRNGQAITDKQWASWTDSLKSSSVPLSNFLQLRSMPDIVTELSFKHIGKVSTEQKNAVAQAHKHLCGAPQKKPLTKDEAADTTLKAFWKTYVQKIKENFAWGLAMPFALVASAALVPVHFVQKHLNTKTKCVSEIESDEEDIYIQI